MHNAAKRKARGHVVCKTHVCSERDTEDNWRRGERRSTCCLEIAHTPTLGANEIRSRRIAGNTFTTTMMGEHLCSGKLPTELRKRNLRRQRAREIASRGESSKPKTSSERGKFAFQRNGAKVSHFHSGGAKAFVGCGKAHRFVVVSGKVSVAMRRSCSIER